MGIEPTYRNECDTQVLKTRRVTRPYAPPAWDYNTGGATIDVAPFQKV